jgi:hypothetical protein
MDAVCNVCFVDIVIGAYTVVNSFQVMAVTLRPIFGVLFLRGSISLKNWSYRPLLRDSTSPFKGTCLFIKLKEVPAAKYGRYGYC